MLQDVISNRREVRVSLYLDTQNTLVGVADEKLVKSVFNFMLGEDHNALKRYRTWLV